VRDQTSTRLLLRCPNAESGSSVRVPDLPPPSDPRWHVPKPILNARVLRRIEPRFTLAAWERCVAGVVVAELLLDREGNVVDGRLLKGLPYGLNEQAAGAARHELYEPARIGQQAVPARLTVIIGFDPNNEGQRPPADRPGVTP
jgi:hypothetical protein